MVPNSSSPNKIHETPLIIRRWKYEKTAECTSKTEAPIAHSLVLAQHNLSNPTAATGLSCSLGTMLSQEPLQAQKTTESKWKKWFTSYLCLQTQPLVFIQDQF